MSHKKFKALRQALRVSGHDPKEVSYRDQGRVKRFYQNGLNLDGSVKMSPYFCEGTRHLSPNCGRAVYKAAKVLGLNPFMEGA